MSTIWQFIATFALPAPLGLLLLLNLPVPKPFKKSAVSIVARVFEVPLLGAFKLLHVMLVILGLSLISTGRVLQRLQDQENSMGEGPSMNPMYDTVRLNKRWRAERNLWLSAFAFTMWTVLAMFYREMATRLRLEERLAEFETSDCTGTIDTTRDVSVSKEVTSRPNTFLSPRKSPQGNVLVSPGRGESPPPAVPGGIMDALKSLDSKKDA
ncbi:hypothetical protein PSENEW3_00001653 [Picochlorum sp. SENEW3]|nr:hypothetical protein PSENEW3_00001653 [Picochlorum sp. SENEW3]